MRFQKSNPKQLSRNMFNSVMFLCAGVVSLALSEAAHAVDTFDYANYPANVTRNDNCSASDVVTDSFEIDGTVVDNLGNTTLIHPGAVIKWVFFTPNEACSGENVSLAMYASNGGWNPNGEVQTLVASRTGSLWSGGRNALYLTVPDTFCGPFQIDAILGTPLPRIGKGGSMYTGATRAGNGFATTDDRHMLVDDHHDTMRGTARNGECPAISSWPDRAAENFDYVHYPTNQLTVDPNQCSASSIFDGSESTGFWLNGARIGNDTSRLVLQPGDELEYRFKNKVPACNGQKVSLAMYRNPNGAFGLYMERNQRLVVSDSIDAITDQNNINVLKINVPAAWDGGWQLDVVFGSPLPIIGDIGNRYMGESVNMLKTSAHGFIAR